MDLELASEASARLASAKAAADRRYYREKEALPRTLNVYDWEEAVRGLCAFYVHDVVGRGSQDTCHHRPSVAPDTGTS